MIYVIESRLQRVLRKNVKITKRKKKKISQLLNMINVLSYNKSLLNLDIIYIYSIFIMTTYTHIHSKCARQ